MPELFRHTRLALVALAAIIGMLSSAEGVAACSEFAATDRGSNCCDFRPMDACGGCETSATPQVEHREQPRSAASGHSASPCECRADVPKAPASKSERPSSERRQGTEQVAAEVRHAAEDTRPSPSHLVTPGDSPPGCPLYLRTSRLLC